MKIQLPEKVKEIIYRLENGGYEAYAVGGCVRDSIMGLEPGDWDICTSALPEEMKSCLAMYRLVETGIKHGTITVVDEGNQFEVTTFRLDGKYLDNRHPEEVTFVTSLEEDLRRRDFTVNAMAYNDYIGLVDLHGGREDLEAGVIRCVGAAKERFEEDALRIMRGLRFSSVLGFEIDGETDGAIRECRNLLKNVSAERLRVELEKLICGRDMRRVMNAYRDVIAVFIPEIQPMFDFDQHNRYHNLDVWQHTLKAMENIEARPVLRMTMLLHDISKPEAFRLDENGRGHFTGHPQLGSKRAAEILKRLKYDRKTIDRIQNLVFSHDGNIDPVPSSVKGWLRTVGPECFAQVIQVKIADASAKKPEAFEERMGVYRQIQEVFEQVISEKQCYCLKDMAVKGSDIMEIGVPGGEYIGYLLNQLLSAVINGELPNEREALMGRVMEMIGSKTNTKDGLEAAKSRKA